MSQGEQSPSDKVSRLSALAGESFEAWWNRYVHGRLLNRDHREQARDGWLAREAQLRAAVAGALEWAAGWIENSATDATREFARNMAMTIRAQRGAWSSGSAPLSAASTSELPTTEKIDHVIEVLEQIAKKPEDKFSHRYFAGHAAILLKQLSGVSSEGRSLPEILATARSSEAYRQETAALDAAESHEQQPVTHVICFEGEGAEVLLCRGWEDCRTQFFNGIFGDGHHDWDEEQIRMWDADLADDDNWVTNDDGKRYRFESDIGEISHARIYVLAPSSATRTSEEKP
jgi:hypothetical protein